MKKFNKKLTINLPDDTLNTNQNQSISVQPTSNNRYLQFKDNQDSQNGQNKHESANFVEFQQFTVNNIKQQENDNIKLKKKFNIDLPDPDKNQQNWRGQKQQKQQFKLEQRKFKQPPAPSKGSIRNKVFVFPQTPTKNIQKEENLNDLKKIFQRQRQQFYKEKSKLQKQILIKNGQIDMLQKIVKQKYSSFPSQTESNKKLQLKYRQQSELETILLQKDLQINELFEKISFLNDTLAKKTQCLNKQIIENSTLQSVIDSLKNQIFVYEKRQVNEKMTKRFYKLKHERQKYGDNDWRNDDFQSSLNLGQDFGMKGLQYLHKRIQKVKMDRVDYNCRNKIKSEMILSQTTKNKNKISFDFKGKVYDRQKKVNLNQTRMY